MKKIYTILLVLGLLLTMASGLSAEEDDRDDIPDNLVRPTTTEGDVFILGDPTAEIYPEDDQKGFEEPLILPNPQAHEEGLIIAPYHGTPSFSITAEYLQQVVHTYLSVLLEAIFSFFPVA